MKDYLVRCAGTRVRVEARAALEQAEELRRTLEELGATDGLGGGPSDSPT